MSVCLLVQFVRPSAKPQTESLSVFMLYYYLFNVSFVWGIGEYDDECIHVWFLPTDSRLLLRAAMSASFAFFVNEKRYGPWTWTTKKNRTARQQTFLFAHRQRWSTDFQVSTVGENFISRNVIHLRNLYISTRVLCFYPKFKISFIFWRKDKSIRVGTVLRTSSKMPVRLL